MRSISYKILEVAVRLTGYQKLFSLNESELRVYINNNLSDQKTAPPKFIGKRHVLRELTFNGKPCYIIKPKTNVSTKTVLFLHGGGFMMEANFTHWMAVLFFRVPAKYFMPKLLSWLKPQGLPEFPSNFIQVRK